MSGLGQFQTTSITGWRQHDAIERKRYLWRAQTVGTQQFFAGQAQIIRDAIMKEHRSVFISFPEDVYLWDDVHECWREENVPCRYRQQRIGFPILKKARFDLVKEFVQKMSDLQRSTNWAVAACAELLRYQCALSVVKGISEELIKNGKIESIELAFDDQYQLLLGSLGEAKESLEGLKAYLSWLNAAFVIDADIEEENDYQLLHSKLTEIWIHQGCALAHYQTLQLINTIRERAANQSLNRGLSISLPYFDDRDLQIRTYDFEVIPPGRIAFEPYFVVKAAQTAKREVANDSTLSQRSRKRLLEELDLLEKSFAIGRHYMPIGMLSQIEGFMQLGVGKFREKSLR